MDTQNAEAIAPTLPDYRDRSTGLTVFGILTICLGGFAGLMILMMLLGQLVAVNSATMPPNSQALLPTEALYAVMGVALVWLGIGSIKARRWARALLLIFSWSWLVVGVLTTVMMMFLLPKIFSAMAANGSNGGSAPPAGAIAVMMVIMALVFGVLFVIMPACWTFFYRSSHVKATCEARDPVTRWTDGCPLPVLGLSLWLILCAAMMLLTPISMHGVIPFFGIFLTGAPGILFYLLVAALWGYSAWLLYHLDARGWWLVLISFLVFLVSTLITYARHDIVEMYQLMGYPQAQIDQIQKSGLFAGNRLLGWSSMATLPLLGYLLFVKRYLRRKA